jgi:pSer/pThr/pTyr-binding forkhead associated (FHA) protein
VLVLRATAGPCKGAVFDEQVERRRIGRGPKGNTVCLKDASVSQRHAEVVWTGAEWTLTDVGSSNGTLLNDVEQRQGKRAPRLGAHRAARSRRAPLPARRGARAEGR